VYVPKENKTVFRLKREAVNRMAFCNSSILTIPMETPSIGLSRYVLTFIDDFTKKVFVYFLKNKSDVFDHFVEFKAYIEKQTDEKIKMVRTDNGKEYVNQDFIKFCKKHGIVHELTVPYTPQQNGVAERMNRTLVEKAKCLLFDAGLPKYCWAEAIHMSAHLINRIPSKGKVPDALFYNKKVSLQDLKLFGTRAKGGSEKMGQKIKRDGLRGLRRQQEGIQM
jgi:hypothetical protein